MAESLVCWEFGLRSRQTGFDFQKPRDYQLIISVLGGNLTGYQSLRKRKITRIGMHVFFLGRMNFVRQGRSSAYACFFLSARAKNPGAERSIPTRRSKSPLILSILTHFTSRGRRDYCPVSVNQSYDSDCSLAILTDD